MANPNSSVEYGEGGGGSANIEYVDAYPVAADAVAGTIYVLNSTDEHGTLKVTAATPLTYTTETFDTTDDADFLGIVADPPNFPAGTVNQYIFSTAPSGGRQLSLLRYSSSVWATIPSNTLNTYLPSDYIWLGDSNGSGVENAQGAGSFLDLAAAVAVFTANPGRDEYGTTPSNRQTLTYDPTMTYIYHDVTLGEIRAITAETAAVPETREVVSLGGGDGLLYEELVAVDNSGVATAFTAAGTGVTLTADMQFLAYGVDDNGTLVTIPIEEIADFTATPTTAPGDVIPVAERYSVPNTTPQIVLSQGASDELLVSAGTISTAFAFTIYQVIAGRDPSTANILGLVSEAEAAKNAAEAAQTAAETAQTAAEAAETDAHTAETQAIVSRTAAATSATQAASSASDAQTAENNAETAETNAETAETNAETAVTAAELAATEAAAYAAQANAQADIQVGSPIGDLIATSPVLPIGTVGNGSLIAFGASEVWDLDSAVPAGYVAGTGSNNERLMVPTNPTPGSNGFIIEILVADVAIQRAFLPRGLFTNVSNDTSGSRIFASATQGVQVLYDSGLVPYLTIAGINSGLPANTRVKIYTAVVRGEQGIQGIQGVGAGSSDGVITGISMDSSGQVTVTRSVGADITEDFATAIAALILAGEAGLANALASVDLPTPIEALVGRVFNTDGTLVVCRRYLQPGHLGTVDWTQWALNADISAYWTGETGLTFRGVISRSSDISNPVNQDVYVTPGGVWFRRIVSNIQTGWFAFRNPHGWIGEFESELDADSQVTENSQIAEWENGVWISSNFVAPVTSDVTYGYERARAFATSQLDSVTQAEAEAGTVTDDRLWSPERVAQAIAALAAMSSAGFHFTSGAPADSVGENGDGALDYTNGVFYEKVSGSWTSRYTDQIGQAGTMDGVINALSGSLSGATLTLTAGRSVGADVVSQGISLPFALLTGAIFTGHVSGIAPTLQAHLTRRDYVDNADALRALLTGATFTGAVKGITPVDDTDFVIKSYVDGRTTVPTHTTDQYVAVKATSTFVAADFTGANGIAFAAGSATAIIPDTLSGNIFVAVARLGSDPDAAFFDIGQSGFNQIGGLEDAVEQTINGSLYEVRVTENAGDYGGEIVEYR